MLCRTAPQLSITEAAHVGDRGLGQKCSDIEAVPLCGEHHRTGKEAHHVLGKRFWEYHRLGRELMITVYHAAFEAETGISIIHVAQLRKLC